MGPKHEDIHKTATGHKNSVEHHTPLQGAVRHSPVSQITNNTFDLVLRLALSSVPLCVR